MNFVGIWKSEDPAFKNIIFEEGTYRWGDDKGRWAVQGSEIWLLNENSTNGTKWFFEFKGNDSLLLHDPEDFHYRGGGNYIYFQMTSPESKITFTRKKK